MSQHKIASIYGLHMPNIHEEIDREWRKNFEDAGHEVPKRDFTDIITDRTNLFDQTKSALQPKLAIFEFGIEWLSYVHVVLDEFMELQESQSAQLLSTWALTGAAVSFGLSIRVLCLSGFLTSARALLRTYADALFTCLAILNDPNLASAFVEAGDDDQKVKEFWHTQASPKNLHKRIMQIEKATGFDQAVIDEMTQWRLQEFARQSQSTHLSYLSAVFTAWHPTKDKTNTIRIRPALFGAPSKHSSDIINYASATTWYFSRLSYNKIIGKSGSGSLFVVDHNNVRHHELVVAHEVLSRVWLSHGGWS